MTNKTTILQNLDHFEVFLKVARAALESNVGPEKSAVNAAAITLRESSSAFDSLMHSLPKS